MADERESRRLSRRQLLLAGAAGAVGIAGLAVLGTEVLPGPTSSPAATVPPPQPSTNPAIGAEATGSPAPASGSAQPAGARVAYQSRPDLTPPVISVVTPAGAVAPGLIFYSPSDGAKPDGLAIVDNRGELVWAHPTGQTAAVNLGVATYRGEPVLYWWEGANNQGVGTGNLLLADAGYREIAKVAIGDGRTADLHEFLVTPQGTAIFFADTGIAGTDAAGRLLPYQLLDCEIQEVDIASGRLVWSWHSADHIAVDETYVAPPTQPGKIFDYAHANSIAVDTDGNLLLSARNTCAIYKIERSSGRILWRLGGRRSDFVVAPDAAFSWQHDARRQPDGLLTLFDDGNTNSPQPTAPTASAAATQTPQLTPTPTGAPVQHPSRGIVLKLDETAMTAVLVGEFAHPSPLLATSQGNMQILPNGNVFIGWGSTPWFTEFDPTGKVVFDATFPAGKMSYRAYRFPWTGTPTDPPAVAVIKDTVGTPTAYASWNGATGVSGWEAVTGDSPATLTVVASAPRAGFETAIPLPSAGRYVAVRARDAAGQVIGSSEVIAV
jgi:hypothetical protein